MEVLTNKRAITKMAVFATALILAAPGLAESGSEPAAFQIDPVSEDMLKAIAGREDVTQIAQADQAAAVSRNSVGDNSVTGEVQISDNAFQNMSGLSVLNVNTGNNVAINASMNVNISISPQ